MISITTFLFCSIAAAILYSSTGVLAEVNGTSGGEEQECESDPAHCTRVVEDSDDCSMWATACVQGGSKSPFGDQSDFNPSGGGGGSNPEGQQEPEPESTQAEGCWRDLTSNRNARVSGTFGERRASGPHKGIDIAVPTGTSVKAPMGGRVTIVKERYPDNDHSTSMGNYVIITYTNGDVGRFLHLKHNGVSVSRGNTVTAGQVIAKSNNTGRSSGPHLHYDHNDGGYVDPKVALDDC